MQLARVRTHRWSLPDSSHEETLSSYRRLIRRQRQFSGGGLGDVEQSVDLTFKARDEPFSDGDLDYGEKSVTESKRKHTKNPKCARKDWPANNSKSSVHNRTRPRS